jgi:hypothetical protein
MYRQQFLKMDQVEIDGTAGGGSSGGSLLGQGRAAGTPAGAENPGGGTGTPGAGGDTPPPAAPSGNAPADWRLALSPELQAEAMFKTIPDVATLAKNYLNAQKLVGADKIPVPSKHATPDDWKTVYQKLGLPVDLKDYTLKEAPTVKGEFVEQFKASAHKAGILPRQAQEVLDWFAEANVNASNKLVADREASYATQIQGLKEEWGTAFNAKINSAKQVIQKFADKDIVEHLEKSGIANDVKLAKFLSKIGESLTESGIVGADPTMAGAKSPAEAKKDISRVQGDRTHPYHNKSHPSHDAAVKEMQDLFGKAYPQV